MSSDESDNDEDYVPSEPGSVHSEENSEDDGEYDDAVSNDKRRKAARNGHGVEGENGNNVKEKTEDELWNEFLGGTTENKNKEKDDPSAVTIAKEPSGNPVARSSAAVSPKETKNDTVKSLFKEAEAADESSKQDAVAQGKNDEDGSKDTNSQTSIKPETKPQLGASSSKSGFSSLLDRISKDKKMTVMEKSRKDWEGYKTKEGITEELSTHNRGKGGFLERKEFLERSDYRQFEQERDMRLAKKRKSALD